MPVHVLQNTNDLEETNKDAELVEDVLKKFEEGRLTLKAVKTRLNSLTDPKALRLNLGRVLRLNNNKLTLDVLKRAYPDKNEFMSLKSFHITPYEVEKAHPLGSGVLFEVSESRAAICKYLGKRLPVFVTSMEMHEFGHMLGDLPEGTILELARQYPHLFTYADEKRDFFDVSLTALPGKFLKKYLSPLKDKLKENSPYYGQPYLFSLFEDEEMVQREKDMFTALLRDNPSFLEVRSVDGLTLEDFCNDVWGYKGFFRNLKKEVQVPASGPSRLSKQ